MAAYAILTAALGYAAFATAGVALQDWAFVALAIGLTAIWCVREAPPLPGWLRWPLLLLPVWILVQMAPLPPGLVRLLSPARAAIADAAALTLGGTGWTPFSVAPAATGFEFLRIAACVLVFLIVREIAWRYPDRGWMLAIPLVATAALEAVLGIAQFYLGRDGAAGTVAHGTYVNRDHFAGLLEMVLPFPVLYATAALRSSRARHRAPMRPAAIACASLAVAATLISGSIHSLSRMGFMAALLALGISVPRAIREPSNGGRRLPRMALAAGAAALVLGLFVYLPPDELIARFSELASADKITAQDRLQLWKETLPLIAAYPVTGCGLGGYESAFSKYKASGPMNTDDYAHNDYLQNLAELGLIGFALEAVLIGGVVMLAFRSARTHPDLDTRCLALACAAGISAILLHSLVDFNLYIPANAMVFAWILGLASATPLLHGTRKPAPRGMPQVIDVQPIG